jgi:DNA-binding NarL/FixJ family response regulator
VIDHEEPLDDSVNLVARVRDAYPMTPLIVCGLPPRASLAWSQFVLRYIEAGATGYVSVDDDPAAFGGMVDAAIVGDLIVDPHIAADLLDRVVELNRAMRYQRRLPAAAPLPDLTPRRAEILALLADGYTNQEIAERLSIAVGTVKNHVHGILRAWQITSREQATELYWAAQELKGIASRPTSAP